jgi:glutathione S-transferase
MTAPYYLYGAYASYYTAKTRSYLRKKGIPFVERLPSHPHFRKHVSVEAESKRIPILEAPDGTVVQDTTEIFEFLEARHSDPPALPPGPRQRLAAYLLDLFASENTKIAWHFRWNFPDANQFFVTMDFGRSFKPQGSDDELRHYGDLIAKQMDGHRANIGIMPEHFAAMDAIYSDCLDILERHFTRLPYLFGGIPSIADYALMGPFFAHLGRDPYPRNIMQSRAIRLFRWTEHMLTPEISSPEFPDLPIAYLAGDEVPETVSALLAMYCADQIPVYRETAALYRDWCAARVDRPTGSFISDEGRDQPSLGRITVPLRGTQMTMASPLHSLWVLQRTLDWLRTLAPEARDAAAAYAAGIGADSLLSIEIARPLMRRHNRLAVG